MVNKKAVNGRVNIKKVSIVIDQKGFHKNNIENMEENNNKI